MNAPEQLSFFEPTGDELAALVVKHLASAERARGRCDLLTVRGMAGAAQVYAALVALFERQAMECAMCCEFERLGGVS